MNLVVMPVHNNLSLTKEALASALAQDIGDVLVMVLNDASTDGTTEWLHANVRPGVSAMHFLKPKGVSKLWNIALGYAFGVWRLPHALVINNDIVLRPDAFRLLAGDGGGFVTGVGTKERDGLATADPSSRSPHPDFSCFLIRRETWEQVGPFDESMVIFASDGDYHLRMDAAGIEAYSVAIPFFHHVSATVNRAEAGERERILAIADADRTAFERKWGCAIGGEAYYQRFKATRDNRYEATGRL